jgi:hypothetical protein
MVCNSCLLLMREKWRDEKLFFLLSAFAARFRPEGRGWERNYAVRGLKKNGGSVNRRHWAIEFSGGARFRNLDLVLIGGMKPF